MPTSVIKFYKVFVAALFKKNWWNLKARKKYLSEKSKYGVIDICLFVYLVYLFASPQHSTTTYRPYVQSEVIPGCQRREHVPRWSELHDNPIIIQHVQSTRSTTCPCSRNDVLENLTRGVTYSGVKNNDDTCICVMVFLTCAPIYNTQNT